MQFENNDLIIFEDGSTGTFVDDVEGAYIEIKGKNDFIGTQEGYKKDYHNRIIIAYIRDGVYHAISDKTRRQLICDGIIESLDYVLKYSYVTELQDKINQIKADVIKIQSL